MQNLVAEHQSYSPFKNRSVSGTSVVPIFQIESRAKAEGRNCGIQKVCNGKRQLKFLCCSELKECHLWITLLFTGLTRTSLKQGCWSHQNNGQISVKARGCPGSPSPCAWRVQNKWLSHTGVPCSWHFSVLSANNGRNIQSRILKERRKKPQLLGLASCHCTTGWLSPRNSEGLTLALTPIYSRLS